MVNSNKLYWLLLIKEYLAGVTVRGFEYLRHDVRKMWKCTARLKMCCVYCELLLHIYFPFPSNSPWHRKKKKKKKKQSWNLVNLISAPLDSVNSRSWWWTGRPGVLRFMGSQRVRHDWANDLIWSEPQVWKLWLKSYQNIFSLAGLIGSGANSDLRWSYLSESQDFCLECQD